MTPEEAFEDIKKAYRDLIKRGWKLHEIDMCDIHFLFDLLDESEEIKVAEYADDVPWL